MAANATPATPPTAASTPLRSLTLINGMPIRNTDASTARSATSSRLIQRRSRLRLSMRACSITRMAASAMNDNALTIEPAMVAQVIPYSSETNEPFPVTPWWTASYKDIAEKIVAAVIATL